MSVQRLIDIKQEMLSLLEEAREIARQEGGVTYARAHGYWLAHIETAITRESDYIGASMFTMEDTIDEMARRAKDTNQAEEEDEDEYDARV